MKDSFSSIRVAASVCALAGTFVFSGCASSSDSAVASPPNASSSSDHAAAAQVEGRLHEIFDAAAKQDMPRLDSYHLYGPAFTKFAGEHPPRLDADAARAGEHQGLSAISNLSMKADDLKIDVFGQTAIATFLLNYSFNLATNTVQKNDRTTLVFVKDRGQWKIVHEHLSPYKSGP
ncbi:MAG: nuclear transport factor 2 family protein [Verrucomicrobia subdivision 3 bacterium]|nr:nuclear transport factor 2 family protein [Limisphaerales bacterium]